MGTNDVSGSPVRSKSPSLAQKPNADGRGVAAGRGRGSQGRGGFQASGRGARGALNALGGRSGAPETRSDTRGRWGKAPLPQAPPTHQEEGARQLGVVVTVRETFGFIK